MAIPRLSLNRLAVAAIAAVIFGIAISAVQANPMPSAPAPTPASSNSHRAGTNIHSADIPSF